MNLSRPLAFLLLAVLTGGTASAGPQTSPPPRPMAAAAPSASPATPAGPANPAPADSAIRRIDLPVTAFTLKNGMRFLVLPRHDVPTVACSIQFKVGSANEHPGITGGSHLLEHMMFKGTHRMGTWDYNAEVPLLREIDRLAAEMIAEQKKLTNAYGGGDPKKVEALKERIRQVQGKQKKYVVSEELWGVYQRNGAVGLNATTGSDETRYYTNLPANRLELWAFLESDRMSDPVFREFYTERDVVLEERRQSVDNNPSGRLFEALQTVAYSGSPYHWPVIGWPSDLQSMCREDMVDYFHTFYAPNNAVAVIVGDVKPEEVQALAERYFAKIPSHTLPVDVPTRDLPNMGERRITVELDSHPVVYTAYAGPPFGSDDEFVLDVTSQILSEGRTSRLHRVLVEQKRIAASAFALNYGRPLGNLFIVGGATQGTHTCREIEDAIWQELERLKTTPVEAWELEKVQNNLEADFVRGLRTNMGMASQLAQAELHMGGWRNFDQRARWRAVTPQRIMEAARRYFIPRNRTVAELVQKAAPAATPGAVPQGGSK